MTQDSKPPYDQKFLDEMKRLLTQSKEWMEQGVAVGDQEIIEYIGGVNAGIDQHPADDASAIFEQTLALTLRNTLAGTLTEINEALQAIEEGTYGRCEDCGSWIDPARLRVMPFTKLCFDCAAEKARDFEPPKY